MTSFKQYFTEMTEQEKNLLFFKNPRKAYLYALKTGKRFIEAESYILKNSEVAYRYAKDVIKERWPELEKTITDDLMISIKYCADVIRGRWPEFEEKIMPNKYHAHEYLQRIVRGRWPEYETFLLKYEMPQDFFDYVWILHRMQTPYSGHPSDTKDDKKFKELSTEILRSHIAKDPTLIGKINNEFCTKELQELALKVGGKRIYPLINDPDPEIKKLYPELTNLKRSGLFR